MSTVSIGDVIVATGRLRSASSGAGSIVWLLVDDKPYPAALAVDGTFYSAISTSTLGAGLHYLSAYIADPSISTYLRILPRREFALSLQRTPFRATPARLPLAAECRDALMATTDT
jgi:hypothetical protein